MTDGGKSRTTSELLFEEYLSSNGYMDWDFEPDIPGQTRRPDYLLRWKGGEFLLEVKQMLAKGPLPRIATVDPYKGLREEINEARRKFRKLKQWCCSLVVCNISDWRTDLNDPREVFGAMLGNFGLTMPFDPEVGLLTDAAQPAFLEGGKMIRYKTGEPQNTTISALVVLERFQAKDLDFVRETRREMSRREAAQQRELQVEEKRKIYMNMLEQRWPKRREVPRVIVYENPFARIPLSRDLFKAAYDERLAFEDDTIRRIYAGDALTEQEEAEGKA